MDATCGTAGSLAVRSLVLLHDVLEGLLIEVAARLVLVGTLVDVLGPASSVRHHQVLLVS